MNKRSLRDTEDQTTSFYPNQTTIVDKSKRHQQVAIPKPIQDKPIVSYYTSQPRTAYYTAPSLPVESPASDNVQGTLTSSMPSLLTHHGRDQVQQVLKSYETAPVYVRQMVNRELERLGLFDSNGRC